MRDMFDNMYTVQIAALAMSLVSRPHDGLESAIKLASSGPRSPFTARSSGRRRSRTWMSPWTGITSPPCRAGFGTDEDYGCYGGDEW